MINFYKVESGKIIIGSGLEVPKTFSKTKSKEFLAIEKAEQETAKKAQAKASINKETEQAIFKQLNVNNTNDALIKQVMSLSNAVAFLADKTDRRTLSDKEKTGLNNALVDYNNINAIVKKGKEKKESI